MYPTLLLTCRGGNLVHEEFQMSPKSSFYTKKTRLIYYTRSGKREEKGKIAYSLKQFFLKEKTLNNKRTPNAM